MNRQRKLAEQGLEDSPMILANSFGGTPGFYHGVASGMSLVVPAVVIVFVVVVVVVVVVLVVLAVVGERRE
jgi:uncharacterized membrane protein